MIRRLLCGALAGLAFVSSASAQGVPAVIPAQAEITIANGVDTRVAVFDVRAYESITLICQNSDAADAWVNGRVDVAVTGTTAAPALAANDWAPLSATDYPQITTIASLPIVAAGPPPVGTAVLSLDTRGIAWIQVVAQGNGANSEGIIQFSGVARSN